MRQEQEASLVAPREWEVVNGRGDGPGARVRRRVGRECGRSGESAIRAEARRNMNGRGEGQRDCEHPEDQSQETQRCQALPSQVCCGIQIGQPGDAEVPGFAHSAVLQDSSRTA